MRHHGLTAIVLIAGGIVALLPGGAAAASIPAQWVNTATSAIHDGAPLGGADESWSSDFPTAPAEVATGWHGTTIGGYYNTHMPYDTLGKARVGLPGSLQSYSSSVGDDGSPGLIHADALARSVSHWTVGSGTLAPGTARPIDVFSILDGFLYTSWNSGNPVLPLTAFVDLEMWVHHSSGLSEQVFNGEGLLSRTTFSQTSSGADWASAWTNVPLVENGIDYLWELDYAEMFTGAFFAQVGETFAFEVLLKTDARNENGAYEIYALSDFYNTAAFDLLPGTTDITLIPGAGGSTLPPPTSDVPEPGSLVLLGAGASLLLMGVRRRRRARSD